MSPFPVQPGQFAGQPLIDYWLLEKAETRLVEAVNAASSRF
jgi:hypothetical protein